MFEIGNTLREARQRRGLDLRECEAGTKIRSGYLRALEEERFDDLPAPAYVRGFLATYAEYLGLDGRLVVDEYVSRYGKEDGDDPDPQPVSVWAERRPRADPRLLWIAAGGLAGVAALVWLAGGLGSDSPSIGGSPVRPTPAAAEAAVLRPVAPPVRGVRLQVTGQGQHGSWIEVRRDGLTGRLIYSGIVGPGVSRSFRAKTALYMAVGWLPSLRVRVNGRPSGASGGTEAFLVTRAGLRPLNGG
ncbi:MAG TPA: RodZ domain-containing protein [Miltoncostaeaceae bacterium]|nr:RodZ domain-containing protein [Miltoncostaeaceae bacterium]